MSTLAKANILELSVSERIQLVEDIWDSITEVPNSIQLSKEQKKTLDQRLSSYHANPELGSPWDIVRERIRSSK